MKDRLTHILLVEDDDDIQEIAKLSLESIGGFKLEVCSSGSEAITKLKTIKPQLILLDVMMPEMDGPTVLKKLQNDAATADIPVIFLTASTRTHEVDAYKKLGAEDVISKPFDPTTLPEALLRIWERIEK